MKRALAYLVMVIVPVLAVSGCSGRVTTAGGAKHAEITVAAASDLKVALPEIIKAFEKNNAVKVTATFGSSGLLAAQIENGAPIDLFLSANKEFVEKLTTKNMLAGKKLFANGSIVLVGKAKSLDELASPEISKIAIANPEHAPYGQAAKEALEKEGLWSTVEPKLVFAENVSQALEFVKTGNADAAFVALSLAKPKRIAYTPIDAALYAPLEQWAGLSSEARDVPASESFVDFLMSAEGRKILRSFGFKTIGKEV